VITATVALLDSSATNWLSYSLFLPATYLIKYQPLLAEMRKSFLSHQADSHHEPVSRLICLMEATAPSMLVVFFQEGQGIRLKPGQMSDYGQQQTAINFTPHLTTAPPS
jgi:hypothetical protein